MRLGLCQITMQNASNHYHPSRPRRVGLSARQTVTRPPLLRGQVSTSATSSVGGGALKKHISRDISFNSSSSSGSTTLDSLSTSTFVSASLAKEASPLRQLCYSNDPTTRFQLRVVSKTNEANQLTNTLYHQSTSLSCDMEWSVLRRGPGRIGMIQLCDDHNITLYHISQMLGGFPMELARLLGDSGVVKFGVNIGVDGKKLKRDWDIDMANLLDLRHMSKSCESTHPTPIKLKNPSLAVLVEHYLPNHCLGKETSIRCSNWDYRLSSQQVYYAANDVYAGFRVYQAIKQRTGRSE